MCKWNGSTWSASGAGISIDLPYYPPYISALALSGSHLYAGGQFTTAGGNTAANIAKWNGSSWSALGSGMSKDFIYDFNDGPYVHALAVSGSNLYAGGAFTTAGGSAVNYIATWNGTNWTALASGMGGISVTYPYVHALATYGSDLLVGGNFTVAGGKASAYVARALLNPPTLTVRLSGVNVVVSWPSSNTVGFALEQASTLAAPATWVTNAASVTDDGTNKSVTVPATNSLQFFRLRGP